ncbi:MAG TPA: WbqC family protein [Legionella sp.]|nr:WbqC family protein [Legionella sp.]
MKKVAIVQSNYIPWKGYFDMIAAVDEFIIFDRMQYTKRDWRNRNQIKTAQGVHWLSIPVLVKGKYFQTIQDTLIDDPKWAVDHWKAITLNYRRSPYFNEIAEWMEPLYLNQSFTHLSDLNQSFLNAICNFLGIKTKISNSRDYNLIEGKTERLLDLCLQAGGTQYISGPAAKDYIEPQLFSDAGVQLSWFDYSGYPEYPQLWGEFVHGVSILDLLFNCGKKAPEYMRYVS